MAWSPDKPYNDLPLLPPAIELETKAVLRRCITARVALAELKQVAELIPNQAMLINTLPLLEARDSSEIENIVTTTDKLFHSGYGVCRDAGRVRHECRHLWQGSIRQHHRTLRDS